MSGMCHGVFMQSVRCLMVSFCSLFGVSWCFSAVYLVSHGVFLQSIWYLMVSFCSLFGVSWCLSAVYLVSHGAFLQSIWCLMVSFCSLVGVSWCLPAVIFGVSCCLSAVFWHYMVTVRSVYCSLCVFFSLFCSYVSWVYNNLWLLFRLWDSRPGGRRLMRPADIVQYIVDKEDLYEDDHHWIPSQLNSMRTLVSSRCNSMTECCYLTDSVVWLCKLASKGLAYVATCGGYWVTCRVHDCLNFNAPSWKSIVLLSLWSSLMSQSLSS